MKIKQILENADSSGINIAKIRADIKELKKHIATKGEYRDLAASIIKELQAELKTLKDRSETKLEEMVAPGAADPKTAWMDDLRKKYPNVKFIQAKMIGAPITAMDNGKEVARWDTKTGKPVGQSTTTSNTPVAPASPAQRQSVLDKYRRT